MRIIVAGSRDIQDEEYIFSVLDKAFGRVLDRIECVISGCARGPDTIGAKWARKNGVAVKEMPADWDKYGKRAGFLRNADMAKIGTHTILFWDGVSPGTKNMLKESIDRGLWTKLDIPNG